MVAQACLTTPDLIQLPASTATAAEAIAGVVVATASETQAAQRAGSAVGAFDGNIFSHWVAVWEGGGKTAWLQIDMNVIGHFSPRSYTLCSASSLPGSDPAAWVVSASVSGGGGGGNMTGGGDWVVIDSRSQEKFNQRHLTSTL